MKKSASKGTMSLGMRIGGMPKLVPTPPSICEIYTCPEAGAPMIRQHEVTVKAGVGIVGDRYALGIGAYSKVKPEKIRHATFIAFESILTVAVAMTGSGELSPFLGKDTRRNFVTWGVDLNELVGRRFSFGDVQFRGVELADPCHRPSALSKRKGFKERFAGIGGLRAEALTDGVVKIRDRFVLL